MPLDKYNARRRCATCKKFRWGYMTFTLMMAPKEFLCGTCELVTYLG